MNLYPEENILVFTFGIDLHFPALRGYEKRVLIYADQLTKAVEHRVETSIDMTKWFHYFATDVMGDLSFGKPFGLLDDRGGNRFLTLLQGTMKNVGTLGHMIWIIPFFMAAPGIDKQIIKFWDFVGTKVNERIDVSLSNIGGKWITNFILE